MLKPMISLLIILGIASPSSADTLSDSVKTVYSENALLKSRVDSLTATTKESIAILEASRFVMTAMQHRNENLKDFFDILIVLLLLAVAIPIALILGGIKRMIRRE